MRNWSRVTKTVILLCGLPGCGKTTFVEALKGVWGGYSIRNDSIRDLIVPPRYDNNSSKCTYNIMRMLASDALRKEDVNIIYLDAPHHRWEEQWKSLLFGRQYNIKAFIVYIKADERLLYQRNLDRDGGIRGKWTEGYEFIRDNFQEPEYRCLTLDSNVLSLDEMINEVKERIE